MIKANIITPTHQKQVNNISSIKQKLKHINYFVAKLKFVANINEKVIVEF